MAKIGKKQANAPSGNNTDISHDKKSRRVACVVCAVAVVCVFIVVLRHWGAGAPFMYAGTLETTKVIVASRVASDVADVYVNEGDSVVRGQPMLELGCDTYKILATQIDNDYERAMVLSQRGHMSQAEFDVLTRNKRDNDLKLGWCHVTAPINGIVITKFREPGEVVSPGTPLISVANPYEIWAYFYVPYPMLHKLRIGQSVVGILPEADNRQFSGRIIKISEQAEFTPKNVQTRQERTRLVYGVKVLFENPDLALKAGMVIESALVHE